MGLPRTFVGFSSTDLHFYRLMQAWKAHDHIDFDFVDCQLQQQLFSEDETYIKRRCRERIHLAGTYVMLIGRDTRQKHKYVRWEAEVAIEKNCRLIGVNLDRTRGINDDLCPPILRNKGAVFVPFSSRILAHAIENYEPEAYGNWDHSDSVYRRLGYAV
jgi:hypothetical protein